MVNARALRPRRAGERGAAVFIVVLVLAMLTGIGLFAARSAVLSTTATGHARQMTQAHYLAEYATNFVLADLDAGGTSLLDQLIPGACSVPARYCRILDNASYSNRTLTPLLEAASAGLPGSLGPAPLDVGWGFKIEVTDKFLATDKPGNDSSGGNNIASCLLTVNTRSVLWPSAMGNETAAMATAGSQGTLSAHIFADCPR